MKADAGRKRTSVLVVGGIIFLLTIVLSAILNSDSYPFVTNFLVDMGVFIGLGFLATILSGERGASMPRWSDLRGVVAIAALENQIRQRIAPGPDIDCRLCRGWPDDLIHLQSP